MEKLWNQILWIVSHDIFTFLSSPLQWAHLQNKCLNVKHFQARIQGIDMEETLPTICSDCWVSALLQFTDAKIAFFSGVERPRLLASWPGRPQHFNHHAVFWRGECVAASKASGPARHPSWFHTVAADTVAAGKTGAWLGGRKCSWIILWVSEHHHYIS